MNRMVATALTVLAFSATAIVAAEPAAAATCSGIVLYGNDFDHPEGINIRSGPGLSYDVIGRTSPPPLHDTAFAVTASNKGWLKIRTIGALGYRTGKLEPVTGFAGEGWVLARGLFISYPAGQSFFLRRAPGSRQGRSILVELEISGPQRIMGCKDSWVQIAHTESYPNDDEPPTETRQVGWIAGSCQPGGPCPFRPSWGKGAEMSKGWPYP